MTVTVKEERDERHENQLKKAVADPPGEAPQPFRKRIERLLEKGADFRRINPELEGVFQGVSYVRNGDEPLRQRHPRLNPFPDERKNFRDLPRENRAGNRQRNENRDEHQRHHKSRRKRGVPLQFVGEPLIKRPGDNRQNCREHDGREKRRNDEVTPDENQGAERHAENDVDAVAQVEHSVGSVKSSVMLTESAFFSLTTGEEM